MRLWEADVVHDPNFDTLALLRAIPQVEIQRHREALLALQPVVSFYHPHPNEGSTSVSFAKESTHLPLPLLHLTVQVYQFSSTYLPPKASLIILFLLLNPYKLGKTKAGCLSSGAIVPCATTALFREAARSIGSSEPS